MIENFFINFIIIERYFDPRLGGSKQAEKETFLKLEAKLIEILLAAKFSGIVDKGFIVADTTAWVKTVGKERFSFLY